MTPDNDDAPRRVHVRKFGAGKSSARMTGPSRFAAAAEEALAGAFTTQAVIRAERFRELMRAKGVPDDAIEAFLATAVIDDESYLSERRRD